MGTAQKARKRDRFVPENGPAKHMLITTRDIKIGSMPTEPTEVSLLDDKDALNLLSTRYPAGVDAEGSSVWTMLFKGIRSYYHTSPISSKILAFLNPDGILIDFLIAGAEGVEGRSGRNSFHLTDLTMAVSQLERLRIDSDNPSQSDSGGSERRNVWRAANHERGHRYRFNRSSISNQGLRYPDRSLEWGSNIKARLWNRLYETLNCVQKSLEGREFVNFILNDDGKFKDRKNLINRQ